MSWRAAIARILVAEEFEALEKQKQELEYAVNNRVAEVLLKMDPWEPLLKKYNVIFSEEWKHPEDNLDAPSQIRLFMWAYQMEGEASFIHLTNWIRNTQGNNTLRRGSHEREWDYGRASIATITLFVDEVSRLASHYRDILASKGMTFDEHLPVE